MSYSNAQRCAVNGSMVCLPDAMTAFKLRRMIDCEIKTVKRMSQVNEFYHPIVMRMEGMTDRWDRRSAFGQFLEEKVPELDQKIECLRLIDQALEDPSRSLGKNLIRTFAMAAEKLGAMTHLWENWLTVGDLNMLCSKPKMGKSRFYVSLMQSLWSGMPWPDGARNVWPVESKTAVMAYDKNHLEIHRDMEKWGIPAEAAINVSDPEDPNGLAIPDLKSPDAISLLDDIFGQDPDVRLLVVDTLTYATTSDLCKPADMMTLLNPVIEVVKKHRVAALLLIHESGEGQPYGKRIKERARILIHLDRYSQEDHNKLRLWVEDGNFPVKPALTMWHEDVGLRFTLDEGPIAKEGKEPRAQTRQKGKAFAAWLQTVLVAGPVAVKELVDQARLGGYLKKEEEYEDGQRPSISPLYDAKKLLERQGVVFDEFKDHRGWTSWRVPGAVSETSNFVSEDPPLEAFGPPRNNLPKHG